MLMIFVYVLCKFLFKSFRWSNSYYCRFNSINCLIVNIIHHFSDNVVLRVMRIQCACKISYLQNMIINLSWLLHDTFWILSVFIFWCSFIGQKLHQQYLYLKLSISSEGWKYMDFLHGTLNFKFTVNDLS